MQRIARQAACGKTILIRAAMNTVFAGPLIPRGARIGRNAPNNPHQQLENGPRNLTVEIERHMRHGRSFVRIVIGTAKTGSTLDNPHPPSTLQSILGHPAEG